MVVYYQGEAFELLEDTVELVGGCPVVFVPGGQYEDILDGAEESDVLDPEYIEKY